MKKQILAAVLAAAMVMAPASSAFAKSSEAAPDWEDYDALIEQIKTETDFAEREGLMHQAEDMLMDTGAIVPIYFYNDVYMQKEAVSGIYSNAYGFKYFMFAENGDSDTLRINLSSEPDKLDPALNSSVDGACLAVSSFTGLFAYDADGQVVPALVDTYEVSDDGLVYTFTLLPDLKWSDGTELNANDFAYAWNRAAAAETGADYFYMFDAIARNEDDTLAVEVSEDGQTLTVTLAAPCAYFLDLCAFPTYYPVKQEAVEAAPGHDGRWK